MLEKARGEAAPPSAPGWLPGEEEPAMRVPPRPLLHGAAEKAAAGCHGALDAELKARASSCSCTPAAACRARRRAARRSIVGHANEIDLPMPRCRAPLFLLGAATALLCATAD
jgi:hypothetical protein